MIDLANDFNNKEIILHKKDTIYRFHAKPDIRHDPLYALIHDE